MQKDKIMLSVCVYTEKRKSAHQLSSCASLVVRVEAARGVLVGRKRGTYLAASCTATLISSLLGLLATPSSEVVFLGNSKIERTVSEATGRHVRGAAPTCHLSWISV